MDDALRTFFTSFERFQYAQCNDMLKSRMSGAQPGNALFAPLLLLSSAESMYQSLSYLEARGAKKEATRFRSKSDADSMTSVRPRNASSRTNSLCQPLSSIFSQLINELKRIEGQMQDSELGESNQVIVFVQELSGLLAIRQELAAMYVISYCACAPLIRSRSYNSFALSLAVPSLIAYDDVAERLGKLQGRLSSASKHPLLLRWKTLISYATRKPTTGCSSHHQTTHVRHRDSHER